MLFTKQRNIWVPHPLNPNKTEKRLFGNFNSIVNAPNLVISPLDFKKLSEQWMGQNMVCTQVDVSQVPPSPHNPTFILSPTPQKASRTIKNQDLHDQSMTFGDEKTIDMTLVVDNLIESVKKPRLNKVRKQSCVGSSAKSAFTKPYKKHSNVVSNVDHSRRIDVRTKTNLRSLFKMLCEHAKMSMKNKNKIDRVVTPLIDGYLNKKFSKVCENTQVTLAIAGILLSKKYKNKFEAKIGEWSLISEDDKQLMIEKTKEFYSHYRNMSISESRAYLNAHPIFRVAKQLILENKILADEYWDRIHSSRKKTLSDKQDFKEIILNDIQNI
jgi:hypothetical protein